jgi:hypothetical protein
MGKYLIMMNIFLKFLKYLNIEHCVGAQVEEDTGPGRKSVTREITNIPKP